MNCAPPLPVSTPPVAEGHHWLSPEPSGSFPLEYVNVNQFQNGYSQFANPMGVAVNGEMNRQHGDIDRQRGGLTRQPPPQGVSGANATTGRAGIAASSSLVKPAPVGNAMLSMDCLPEHERVHFDAGQLCTILYTPYSPLFSTVLYIHHCSYCTYTLYVHYIRTAYIQHSSCTLYITYSTQAVHYTLHTALKLYTIHYIQHSSCTLYITYSTQAVHYTLHTALNLHMMGSSPL